MRTSLSCNRGLIYAENQAGPFRRVNPLMVGGSAVRPIYHAQVSLSRVFAQALPMTSRLLWP